MKSNYYGFNGYLFGAKQRERETAIFKHPHPKNDNIFNEHYLYIIWEIIIDDEHDNRFDR